MTTDTERARGIVSDLRHSAKVDDYEPEQIRFIESIADRIEVALSERQDAVLPPTHSTRDEVAFDAGWMMCARWSKRDDLPADMDSPAYQAQRAEAIEALARQPTPSQHSTQDNYEHFLAYSGLTDDPMLRYAYFHGADEGIDKPAPSRVEPVVVAQLHADFQAIKKIGAEVDAIIAEIEQPAPSQDGDAVRELVVWMVRNRRTGDIWWDDCCVWPGEAEARDCANDMNENIEGADFEAFCLHAATKERPVNFVSAPVERWRDVGQRLLANDDHACEFRAVVESVLAQQPFISADETDKLIRDLGFEPERFRTEGGRVNHYKLAAAIKHPEDYDGLALAQPAAGVGSSDMLDVLPPWPKLPAAWTKATVAYDEDGESITADVWREKDMRAFGRSCADVALAAQPAAAGAVATVCLRGDTYAHGQITEVQLQHEVGVQFPIGTKFYTHPPRDVGEGFVRVPEALSPEQADALAPSGLSWDEAGAWAMGYEACRQAVLTAGAGDGGDA